MNEFIRRFCEEPEFFKEVMFYVLVVLGIMWCTKRVFR